MLSDRQASGESAAVTVWRIDLDLDAATGSPDARHVPLREILAWHAGVEPASLSFGTTAAGKPILLPAAQPPSLGFNLSHSGGVALCAVARGREVGVDIERIRAGRDFVGVARRALPAEVAAELERLPAARRPAVFYPAWVRHEARLKCLGVGLGGAASAPPPAADGVAVVALDAGLGHAAALAISPGPAGPLQTRSWPPRSAVYDVR